MKHRKSPLAWLGLTIVGILILSIGYQVISHFFTQSSIHHIQPHMGHGRGGGFHQRELGFSGHSSIFHFSILSFLFNLAIIALGWWIWRKANGKAVKKWVGFILLGIGIFSILPLIIAIPLMLIAIWIGLKGNNTDEDFIEEPMTVVYPTYTTTTNDILGEWERKTIKEENK